MFKVKIYVDEGFSFITQMPKIPEKGDQIGFWDKREGKPRWFVERVDYIVYEFDERGRYLLAEINLTDSR